MHVLDHDLWHTIRGCASIKNEFARVNEKNNNNIVFNCGFVTKQANFYVIITDVTTVNGSIPCDFDYQLASKLNMCVCVAKVSIRSQ